MKNFSKTLLPLCLILIFMLVHDAASAQGQNTCLGGNNNNISATYTWTTNSITATSNSNFGFKVMRAFGDWGLVYSATPWSSSHPRSGDNNLNNLPQGDYRIFVNDYLCETIYIPGGGGGSSCSLSASISNVTCSDNGTDANPNDDTYGFDVLVTKSDGTTSGSWSTVIDGQTHMGSYGQSKNFSGYAISSGNRTLTITDSGSCQQATANATAPSTCSNGGSTSSNIWTGGSTPTGDISRTGRVGIGTANFINTESYKLIVSGGIKTETVKVALCSAGGWCDYVFAPDYELQPLPEVEQFINKNQHLPNIPSEATMEADGGIDLGNMTVLQQEKIEELFLHVIAMNKELENLKSELEQVKKENIELQKSK